MLVFTSGQTNILAKQDEFKIISYGFMLINEKIQYRNIDATSTYNIFP